MYNLVHSCEKIAVNKQIIRRIKPVLLVLIPAAAAYLATKARKRQESDFGYQMLELTADSREKLLRKYHPKFAIVKAEHITCAYGVRRDESQPVKPGLVEVIGYVSDESLECLVVAVDGTHKRADGGVYHITLSHAWKRAPKESNDLISEYGWTDTSDKLQLAVLPKFRKLD